MSLGNIIEAGLKRVLNTVTGGLAGEVWDLVEKALPDDMPAEKRAELRLGLENIQTQRILAGHQAASDAEKNLTERITALEGTARDLLALPVVGRLILFLRGAQRPAWGFGVMAMDWQIFAGVWKLPEDGPLAVSVLVINILVLGFLFGERAVQNILPLALQLLGKTPQQSVRLSPE